MQPNLVQKMHQLLPCEDCGEMVLTRHLVFSYQSIIMRETNQKLRASDERISFAQTFIHKTTISHLHICIQNAISDENEQPV